MFATNRRFSVKNGQLVTGRSGGIPTAGPAVTNNRVRPDVSAGSDLMSEVATLGGSGFGFGGPSYANSMSVMGSGPMSTTGLLTGLVPENEQLLNLYYRDIYYYDSVAGSAVDMMSTFPFSDFTLMGIDDNKILDKYEESVARLNIRSFLPQVSLCYLVDGKFVSTLVFNKQRNIFHDTIIHDSGACIIEDLPLFSTDPVISVASNPMLSKFMTSNEPQAQLIRQVMGPHLVSALKHSRFKLDPLSTLYLARRTLPNAAPTSYLKRVLPIYLIDKTLYRGTLVEVNRRQRAMLHITMGDDTWEPTPQEMMSTVMQFQQADLDPLGAIVATRNGVQVSEVRQGGDFLKWMDTTDALTPMRLRALGMSEAFLSQDANFSNTETAVSVYMENADAYRSFLTYKVLNNKVFPIIAVMNGYYKEGATKAATDVDRAKLLYNANNQNDLLIPAVRWHKTLKSKDEGDMFQALDYMAEKGIPVPLRMIFAAAKVDPNELWQDLQQDKKLKDRLSGVSGVATDEIAPGGDKGSERLGMSDAGESEFASLLGMTSRQRVGLASREFGETGEVKGVTKTGQAKYVRDQRTANRKLNDMIVKAAARLANNPDLRRAVLKEVNTKLGSTPNMGFVPDSVLANRARNRK